MPIKKISPIATSNNGKPCWRVIVPKDLIGDGPRRKFFASKSEADELAEDLNSRRGDILARIFALTKSDQLQVCAALEIAGSATNLLQAANAFTTAASATRHHAIADVVTECLASKKSSGLRPRSLAGLKSSLGKFRDSIGVVNIGAVEPVMIDSWLSGNGWSAGTRRGYLTDVRTLFSFAVKRQYIKENVANGVEKPKWDGGAPGIHTVDEARKLLTLAIETDPGLIGYIAPIYFGGLRPDEANNLTAKQIHDGLLEVTPEISKTRRRRFIPINDTLKAWLAVKQIEYSPKNLVRRLRRLRKKAGVSWPHDVLRHSFCSYGLPVFGAQKIAEWAGHSESILFAHYRERVKPEDAKAFWALTPTAA